MKCYIISFQTGLSGEARERLDNALRQYPSWARIMPNTWAVLSDDTAITIRENLLQYLVNGDRILVIKSGIESAWSNSMATNEWLKENL